MIRNDKAIWELIDSLEMIAKLENFRAFDLTNMFLY